MDASFAAPRARPPFRTCRCRPLTVAVPVLGVKEDPIHAVARYFSGQSATRGVLVFDGFDAARSDDARERVLALIRRAQEVRDRRWTIMVSVRLFDAARSQSLRSMFRDPTTQPPFKGIELDDTREFRIPLLNDVELARAVDQIPGLAETLGSASPGLRELLRVPFNLWLANKILGTGDDRSLLSGIASESQLLSLYWRRRVLSSDSEAVVVHCLTKLVNAMVTDRTLSVRRADVYEPAAAAVWDELHSAGVIGYAGSTAQRVAFSHNILFDFAVSVLLLDERPDAMIGFIAADFSRPMFLRPSITYYYTRLWYEQRDAFWQSTWVTLGDKASHVRLVGRVVPSAVVVREARTSGDLEPIFDRIDSGAPEGPEMLLRTLQALDALPQARDELWAVLCASAAKRPRREYVWNVITTATRMLERKGKELGNNARASLGAAGRATLKWALDVRGAGDRFVDVVGALWAVPLVAQTMPTAPSESEAVLRRALQLMESAAFPIDYISRLCERVGDIAATAPSLSRDIYKSVFAHSETSDEATHFGSPILPLSSTRRQDFGMCEYVLAKEFPPFLKSAPEDAIAAGLEAFNNYVVREHVAPFIREGHEIGELEYSMLFRQLEVWVIADHSAIWMDVGNRDDALGIQSQILDYIGMLADRGDAKAVDGALDLFAAHARVQAAWVFLLRAAAERPATVGRLLAELALSPDLLRGAHYEMVNFVAASFAQWETDDRRRFEGALERRYAAESDEDDQETDTQLADLLLLALPRDLITSTALLTRLRSLDAKDERPKNERPFTVETFSRQYTDEDWLKDRGVDVAAPANAALLQVAQQLEDLAAQWRNNRPPAEVGPSLVEAIRQAKESRASSLDDVAGDIDEMMATRIAAVASCLARMEGDLSGEVMDIARNTLLDSARRRIHGEPRSDTSFDTPTWSPMPQTEAVTGLFWLMSRGADGQVTDAIEELAASAETAVRFLVAVELFRIHAVAPDAFWRISERFAANEQSPGVFAGLLPSLARDRNDAPRISRVLAHLSERGFVPESRSRYTDAYARLLTWLAFNVEEPWAVATVGVLADNPTTNGVLANRIAFEALSIVTPAYLARTNIRPIADRAVAWVRRLIVGVSNSFVGADQITRDASKVEAAYRIVDDVATRLYLGVHRNGKEEDIPVPRDLREYYTVVRPIVGDIVAFGSHETTVLMAHTTHHLMELLHLCVPLDPRGVLDLAADAATASRRTNYSLDAMAVNEVVAIANDLLADYRATIADGTGVESFVRLLDTFADAGWPDALRLVWQIDQIFR
jgi:hypothetical protein